ncbi:MAG: light-harvesting protein [Pseudomonadota bacterium]
MNNAKMWLVVPPAVGVPVFLGAVAVGSFAVHVAVLSNTSWVSDFLSGQELGAGDEVAAAQAAQNLNTAKAAYTLDLDGHATEVTVILPDGTVSKAILHPTEVSDVVVSASAAPHLPTD